MSKKRNVIFNRIVFVLAVIGTITIVDNGIRLTKELGNGITRVIHNHRWNLVVK